MSLINVSIYNETWDFLETQGIDADSSTEPRQLSQMAAAITADTENNFIAGLGGAVGLVGSGGAPVTTAIVVGGCDYVGWTNLA